MGVISRVIPPTTGLFRTASTVGLGDSSPMNRPVNSFFGGALGDNTHFNRDPIKV